MTPILPRPYSMDPSFLLVELAYAALIIIICLIIYAKTKELYNLSKHEGIRHFREVFLFFSLAYFFRLIPVLFKLTDLHIPGYRIGFTAGFFLFSYASSMAIMSILRSVLWKKMKSSFLKNDFTFRIIALLLALLVLISGSRIIFFVIQAGLITIAFILTSVFSRKKRSKRHITYLLLLLFWMLNIASSSVHKIATAFKETLYFISLILFVIILFKVINSLRRY